MKKRNPHHLKPTLACILVASLAMILITSGCSQSTPLTEDTPVPEESVSVEEETILDEGELAQEETEEPMVEEPVVEEPVAEEPVDEESPADADASTIEDSTPPDSPIEEDPIPEDTQEEETVPDTLEDETSEVVDNPAIHTLSDSIGHWVVERYDNYIDGIVGFHINQDDDNYSFSCSMGWNYGNRINQIETIELFANNDDTIAGGDYLDDRGNTGQVFVFVEDNHLYLTITVTGGTKDYGLDVTNEVCAPFE